ncbi:hypothetical protein QRQ56_26640 [Bradyrhizobium sp. U531]|uniref:hypothetical protein n=1 Tax=Bradyrhizobium sp. U531 TaxID=3053458 RepID=UPI003F41BC10
MAEPTLVGLIGYVDRDRKTKEQTHIITMAGRRLSIPNASLTSQHPIEPGAGGTVRFFLANDAIVLAEMLANDLPEGETHGKRRSQATALRA